MKSIIFILLVALKAFANPPENIYTEKQLCKKLFWDIFYESDKHRRDSSDVLVTQKQLNLVALQPKKILFSSFSTVKNNNFKIDGPDESLMRSLAKELEPYDGDIHRFDRNGNDALAKFFLTPQDLNPIVAFSNEARDGELIHERDHFRFWKEVDKKLRRDGIAMNMESRELAWKLLITPQGRLSLEKRAQLAEMGRTQQNHFIAATPEELIRISNYPEVAAITSAGVYIKIINNILTQNRMMDPGDRAIYLHMKQDLENFAKAQMDSIIIRTKEKYKIAKKFYSREFNRLPSEDRKFISDYQDGVMGLEEGSWLFDMKEPLNDTQKKHLRMLQFVEHRDLFSDYIPDINELRTSHSEVQSYVRQLFNERFQTLKPVKEPELLYP